MQIKSWLKRLEKIQDKISYAVIMANNRYEGFGPATANKMRVLLGLEELSFMDKR